MFASRNHLTLRGAVLVATCLTSFAALSANAQQIPDPRIDEIEQLTNQAAALEKVGKYAEAVQVWKRQLALHRDIVGNEFTEPVASSMEFLAEAQESAEDYAGAAKSWTALANIRGKLGQLKGWEIKDIEVKADRAKTWDKIGPDGRKKMAQADRIWSDAYETGFKKFEFPAAIAKCKEALAIQQAVVGEKSLLVADTRDLLGALLGFTGDHAAHLAESRKVIAIREELLGVHPRTGRAWREAGFALVNAGNRANAVDSHSKALEIFDATLAEGEEELHVQRKLVFSTYMALERPALALPHGFKWIEQSERTHGKESIECVEALRQVSMTHLSLGDFEESLRLLDDAFGRLQRVANPNSFIYAATLDDLASLYLAMGQKDRAKDPAIKAHEIRVAILAAEDRKSALPDRELLELHCAEAEYHLNHGKDLLAAKQSLDLAERTSREMARLTPTLYPEIAHQQNQFFLFRLRASAHALGGDDEAALVALKEASRLLSESYGAKLFVQVQLLHSAASLEARCDQFDASLASFSSARKLLDELRAASLSTLSDRELSAYMQQAEPDLLNQCLGVALAKAGNLAWNEQSAEWILNAKGTKGEVLAQRLALARQSSDPMLESLRSELQKIRQVLAAHYRGEAISVGVDAELRKLAEREREAARKFALASGKNLGTKSWTEVAALRGALAKDTVFVDLVRMATTDLSDPVLEKSGRAFHYAAWIIPPEAAGQIEIVDLGDADALDLAIRDGRRQAQSPSAAKPVPAGDNQPDPLNALANTLLKPLEEKLAGYEHWIISPDADLWLVPWGALPLADGSFSVEKHTISLVVSGRDLLAKPAVAKDLGAALVLADPDYDALPGAVAPKPPAAKEPAAAPEGLVARAPAAERSLKGMKWPELRGTATEAKAIAPRLATLAKAAAKPPVVLTRGAAREEAFKATPRPEVLVLSTHGYFLEEQAPAEGSRGAEMVLEDLPLPRPGEPRPVGVFQPLDNPLLRCGLALAGANQRDKVKSGDDGLLTGLEVLDADLRGTRLVVLSACETAVGEIHNGQGVAGLRQAFQLAGAESVVATLWKIPDAETADLMGRFFEHLAAGKGRAASLRQAQRDFIHARREKGQPVHPYYWAAFTLTGQAD